MEKFVIEGGKKLSGEVSVNGAWKEADLVSLGVINLPKGRKM